MGALTALTPIITGDFHVDLLGKKTGSVTPDILIFTATGPASYDTTGSVIDLSKYITGVPALVAVWPTTSGYTATYVAGADATAGKFKTFSAEGTEVSSTTNLSGETYTFFVTGATMLLS